MKDIYEPDLDTRIHDFMERKTRKYPELHLFDGAGQETIRPRHKSDVTHHRPPRTVLNDL